MAWDAPSGAIPRRGAPWGGQHVFLL